MSRIETIFAERRSAGEGGRKALMPFVCGGHPAPGMLPKLLWGLEQGGASIVEIGIPFSDPIADGPVIAAAMHEALGRGATPESVLDEIASARPTTKLGLVVMVSVSIVWRMGVKAMIERARRAGVDGFIVPDLPVDEAGEIGAAVRDAGMSMSLLVAPTTSRERMERIVKASSGFVYLIARAGITGVSSGAPEIADRVRMLRGMTDLPIACGFGVSTAEQVRAVLKHADAAIVGSALVNKLSEAAATGKDVVEAGKTFTTVLAAGLV